MLATDKESDQQPARPDEPRLSLRLRPTLLAVLLGLLVATVGGIGAIAFIKTTESIETLAHQQFGAVVKATVARVQGVVGDVPGTLFEYEQLARRGVLPLDDEQALGTVFVERLRQNPSLAWLGFGDARDDSFVGATRRSGKGVTLYTARPEINDAVPVETLIERSGRSTIVKSDEAMPYRVSEKAWFQKAMKLKQMGWLDPYVFTDGRRGVTAALPLVMPGNSLPIGVLHADLFIDSIIEFLDGLEIGKTGRAHLLTTANAVVAMPNAWRDGDPALDSALRVLGGGTIDSLTQDVVETAEFQHDGQTWRAAFESIGDAGGPDWVIAVLAPEAEFTGVAIRNAWWTLGGGLAALLIAVFVAAIVSSRIAGPLRRISEDLERVAAFEFDAAAPPQSFVREVASVGQTVARMKSSLRSFSRYVPADLVRELLASGREAELGGERRRLTIHFSDIAGFTSIAETMPPEQLVVELGDYFGTMREVLRAHHGTIDKYMGDGTLAFFNAPRLVDDHEIEACRAALRAQEQLAADRTMRTASGRPAFSVRIGLEVGEVVVGNIGTPDRFAYTVIGDAVNLASRLEGLNKFYGTEIIGSGDLRAATGDIFVWRHLDRVAVVGRTAGTDVQELLGEVGGFSDDKIAARDTYEAALADYLAGRFAEAAVQFGELARAMPNDAAAQIMARRARKLALRPPEGEWTGVYVHAQK
jgi:adenylate cyclase